MAGTGVRKWSKTPADNATADTAVNWAEGQAPSTVNNSARAEMASVAMWRDDLNGTLTTAGTSTAYTLTTNQVLDALTAGNEVTFCLDETNGASPTLNVDGLGAKPLRPSPGVNYTAGVLTAGVPYRATYFTSNSGEWIVHTGPTASSGSWTPVLTFATPGNVSVTYSSQAGAWVRHADQITAVFTIITSAFTHTTAAGALTITGLPVTVGASTASSRGAMQWAGITKAGYTNVVARAVGGGTTIVFNASGSGQAIDSIGFGDVPTGGTVQLVGTVIYSAL